MWYFFYIPYFWSNKYSLVEHKRLIRKKQTNKQKKKHLTDPQILNSIVFVYVYFPHIFFIWSFVTCIDLLLCLKLLPCCVKDSGKQMLFVFPLSIKRLFMSFICHRPARMTKNSWLSCQWWLAALPHKSIPETLQSHHKLIFTVCGRSSTLEPQKTHGPNINCVHRRTNTHNMCKYSPSIQSISTPTACKMPLSLFLF